MINIELKELKKFLHGIHEASVKEKGMRNEIEMIKDRINALRDVSAKAYSLAAGGGSLKDVTYMKAEKVVDTYEREIVVLLWEVAEIQRMRARLNELFKVLEPVERNVITAKYVDNVKWDYMSDKIFLSRAQCFRIHDRAIFKMLNVKE